MSKIFLIPNTLSENKTEYLNSNYYKNVIDNIQIFFVENFKPARKLLKLIDKNIIIDNFEWVEINPKDKQNYSQFNNAISNNKNIGIISDCGCPCVADPGYHLVSLAHEKNISIIPLVGPNSILMALMSSGFNGQQFIFHGYLPIQENEKNKFLKELSLNNKSKFYTHIFIETPYRNQSFFNSILKICDNSTKLSIAIDINGDLEYIKTKSIDLWKKSTIVLNKNPTIFLISFN